MRLSRPLMPQSAARDPGVSSAGPAMTALLAMITRIAIILRGTALAAMLVQLIIWHSYYLARPWRLWAPAVALAWACVMITGLRRGRPGGPLIGADSAVYAVLALAAASCVPPAIRGEAGSWLFILVTSQVVAPTWFAPDAVSVPLAALPAVGFVAGTALAPPASLVTASARGASTALLFIVVVVHWLLRRMLCGRASRADAALAAAREDAREQYVNLSRSIERREQDRLLHDTVLNTLTAIARSGSPASIGQCRRDIALLERALSEPDSAATDSAATDSAATDRAATDSAATNSATAASPAEADPLAAIAEVISEMRDRGLTVDLEPPGPPAASATALLPGPVVAALAYATREALANVAAHAGTGQAWVTVSLTPAEPGGTPAEPGGTPAEPGATPAGQIQITVRDAGAGFVVGQVDPARLGLRRSITERVEDWGGSVSVRSAPGQGTSLCLAWPATQPAQPAQPAQVPQC